MNSIYRDKSTPFFAENAKRAELHRLIFNMSIIKYLFEDEYDQIIKSGDIVSYLYDCESHLISKHLLSDIKRTYHDESEEILKQIKIKFYHLFLFQRLEGEEYLQEIITQTEQRLKRLDSSIPLTSQESTIKEIVVFLDAIKRKRRNANFRITRRRLKKVYQVILLLLNEEKLQLNDILDLIDDKFISIDLLVIEPSFLKDLLMELKVKPLLFTNESERTALSYKISKLEEDIIHYFKGDINLIINTSEAMLQVQYPNSNELEFVKSLFDLNNYLDDITLLERDEDEEIDEFDWFKKNTEILLDVSQVQEVKPKTLKAIDYCRNRVNLLLNMLAYHKDLFNYWSQGNLKNVYEIKPKYLTTQNEVTKAISSIYKEVISQDLVDKDLSELYEYFYLTVIQVSKGESFPKSTIDMINLIYEELDNHYVVNMYEERYWRNCGLLIEKISSLD